MEFARFSIAGVEITHLLGLLQCRVEIVHMQMQ
jgi:hypothetical protein